MLTVALAACSGYKHRKQLKSLAKRQQDTMEHPYWKTMMDDTLATYASTVSAFELYWKDKKRPVRDEDNEGKNLFEKEKEEEEGGEGNYDEVFDYKRFLAWKQKSQNLIKPDGRVMTQYEILQEWKKRYTDTASR